MGYTPSVFPKNNLMPAKQRILLQGRALYNALLASKQPTVKLVINDVTQVISVAMALTFAKVGSYEGEICKTRIRKMKPYEKRKIVHDPAFRDGRPSLQFTPITSKTIALWDKHFGHPKPLRKPVHGTYVNP